MNSAVAPRRLGIAALISLIGALYLADLTGMGLVSADEPRYAAIGRAMAQSGDWITPRLWGQPWFEKPALLYWMTAAGFRLGLGPDLAPRFPVALLSVGFLLFFWWRLRIEWGARVAWSAVSMLATSAGWLAYSHVAVTDLPLAAFFSAAVLLALPWIARRERSLLPMSAACLGLAALSKGLVGLALFLPVFAIGWRNLRDWLRPLPALAFAVCALPWYVLCTMRNGSAFPRVLFLEQTFARFRSAALVHVQPSWYYIPVLLLLLYPWFPVLIFPGRGHALALRDPRIRLLLSIVIFGMVFFSAMLNKLPGYLLPLLPETFVLAALSLVKADRPAAAMVAPVILLGALPAVSAVAPGMLAHGLRSVPVPWGTMALGLAVAALVAAALAAIARRCAFRAAAVVAAIAFLWVQIAVFPEFDRAASARPLWLAKHPECAPAGTRSMLFSLYYYAQRPLPPCEAIDRTPARVVR